MGSSALSPSFCPALDKHNGFIEYFDQNSEEEKDIFVHQSAFNLLNSKQIIDTLGSSVLSNINTYYDHKQTRNLKEKAVNVGSVYQYSYE